MFAHSILLLPLFLALYSFATQSIGFSDWSVSDTAGAVDAGGGGTVAMYVANLDVDVIDVGVPVLSMHAPFEVVSKLDLYSTYQAFVAFFQS